MTFAQLLIKCTTTLHLLALHRKDDHAKKETKSKIIRIDHSPVLMEYIAHCLTALNHISIWNNNLVTWDV